MVTQAATAQSLVSNNASPVGLGAGLPCDTSAYGLAALVACPICRCHRRHGEAQYGASVDCLTNKWKDTMVSSLVMGIATHLDLTRPSLVDKQDVLASVCDPHSPA